MQLHAIGDRIVPEAIEALERAVHLHELVRIDTADLLNRADVALVETGHDFSHFLPLLSQTDANRAAINTGLLVIDEAKVDQFLKIVGNVRSEIVTAGAQLTSRQFCIANIEEQKSLDRVDV